MKASNAKEMQMTNRRWRSAGLTLLAALTLTVMLTAQNQSTDPGPRGGQPGAGAALPGLTPGQQAAFQDGADDFNSAHSVDGSISGAEATGLGPTFNLDNC